jgi:hypothetical protein
VNEQLSAILEDLREFSPELLDPGTKPAMQPTTLRRGLGTLGADIDRAHAFARLVPALMSEQDRLERRDSMDWRTSPIPLRAVLSRAPWHWQRVGTRWLPKSWIVPELELTADPGCARWIEHLIVRMELRLASGRARIAKHADDARSFAPSTAWSRLEIEAQERLLARVDDAVGALARARFAVSRSMGSHVTPSAAPPFPFPRTPPWIAVRELSEAILDERKALQAGFRGLLAGQVDIATEPYLYQRWVGVKLLAAFEQLGWQSSGDVVGSLYLGGSIQLVRDGVRIDLHVEPRLSERSDHPSGCYCTRGGEVTPDYLLVAPGPSGNEAYVLDACKTSDREVLRAKSRYLELVAHVKPRQVAGVWTRHPPRRAWSAAPLDRGVCDLERPDGAAGVVPMNPLPFRSEPIAAWVSDIDREARAWSRAHSSTADAKAQPVGRTGDGSRTPTDLAT